MKYAKLNDKIFVSKSSDIVKTLFNPIEGRTADGHYKVLKNGIKLYKANGELFAFIVTHESRYNPFIVSAWLYNGKTRYQYALTTNDEQHLGFTGLSPLQERDLILNFVYEILKG